MTLWFRRFKYLILAAVAACSASCETQQPSTPPPADSSESGSDMNFGSTLEPFVNRAHEMGIDFSYSDGADANFCTMLEALGGGVAWLDYDRDGWSDLAATGGGDLRSDKTITGCAAALFRNLDGKRFVSVGGRAGVESHELYSNGLAIADYDNDGFQDLLITGYGRPQLWHNMGDGTFLQVANAAGLIDDRWGSSAGWADLNGDGNLDLYMAHYVNWSFENHPFCAGGPPGERDNCPPREFQPLPDSVYFSRGDGTFIDATEWAGLRLDGKGLGVLLCDVEPDGDVDIYVANDTTDNFLYINDGQGKFQEMGIAAGVARDENGIPNGSMGVGLCDFNRDGLPDLWVANYERESFALYRNEGRGHFLHVSQRYGITDQGGLFVGFGTECEDFDSDGVQDVVVANGHVIKFPAASPRKQIPLLLRFDGARFQRMPGVAGSYFGEPHEGRGLGAADFDGDGDLDLAISQLNEPLALLENRFLDQNRWLALELIGTQSNRDAVGARVTLQTDKGAWDRQVTGGGSYLSHSSRRLHFPLPGQAEPISLVVRWPAGEVQTLDATSLAGTIRLVEPLAEKK